MIMSRSTDYALRAMIYLARKRGPGFIPLNEIAREMRTPPFLLARIMQGLVRSNLILSMKGHHGGFRLQMDPADITAAEIVAAIDGPFRVFECNGIAECGLSDACSLVDLFACAENALREAFSSFTLERLAFTAPADGAQVPNRSPLEFKQIWMHGGR